VQLDDAALVHARVLHVGDRVGLGGGRRQRGRRRRRTHALRCLRAQAVASRLLLFRPPVEKRGELLLAGERLERLARRGGLGAAGGERRERRDEQSEQV